MRTPLTSASPSRPRASRGLVASSVLLCAALGLISGCKQNVGERCQLTDDCAPGLVCEFGGNTPAMGGYCKDPTRTTNTTADMTTVDQATPADMASSMSTDMM
jgi:hypothetical protein